MQQVLSMFVAQTTAGFQSNTNLFAGLLSLVLVPNIVVHQGLSNNFCPSSPPLLLKSGDLDITTAAL
jgi:hypothetical protein